MKKISHSIRFIGIFAFAGLIFLTAINTAAAEDDGFGHNKRFDQQWGSFSDSAEREQESDRDSGMDGRNATNQTNSTHTESSDDFIDSGSTGESPAAPDASESDAGGVPQAEEDSFAPEMSGEESSMQEDDSAQSEQEAIEDQLVEEYLGDDSPETDAVAEQESVPEDEAADALQDDALIEESVDEVDESEAAEDYYEEADDPFTESSTTEENRHFPLLFSRILLAGLDEPADGEDGMNDAYEAVLEDVFTHMPYMLELDYPSIVLAASDILEAESGEDPWQGEIPAEALVDFWAFFELNDDLHDYEQTAEIIAALTEHYSEYEGATADRVKALKEAAGE